MAQEAMMAAHPGIKTRHRAGCASEQGRRCNCRPKYLATIYSRREKKQISKQFDSLAAAKAWRRDASKAIEVGSMRAPTKATLADVAEAWLAGARAGAVRNRSGDVYKPSAVRSYQEVLRKRVLPQIGHLKLSQISRHDLRRLVESWQQEGLDPSTIRNQLLPLRAIYRQALENDEVAVNPLTNLSLPAVRGKRDRIADPEEARALIEALPNEDRALWATAMYAGLRRGELLALRWSDVDVESGVIRVRRSWDVREGVVGPKSQAGTRSVPIAGLLKDLLVEHRLRQGRGGDALVFGISEGAPFSPKPASKRANAAWRKAGLEPITLHEARHTFASLMIAAGVNAKALTSFMGHSSITITLDRYGHLMPGSADEAARLLDAYLERADGQAPSAASRRME